MRLGWLFACGGVVLLGCSSTSSGLGEGSAGGASPDASGAGQGGQEVTGGGSAAGGGTSGGGGAPVGGTGGSATTVAGSGGTSGGTTSGGGSSGGTGSAGASTSPDGGAPTCDPPCPANETCDSSMTCVCKSGYVPTTAGDCVTDPCSDANACGTNEVCSADGSGEAVCDCAPGHTRCGAACVDLQTDAAHCGACDYGCWGNLGCSGGVCEQLVHELVLGATRSCALMEPADANGSYDLRCWGATGDQFFRGTPTDNTVPSPIEGISRVRGAALTDHRFCIIQPTVEEVSCWGDCAAECDPDVLDSATLVDTPFGTGLVQIDVATGLVQNRGGTCGVTQTGLLQCWGFSEMIADTIDRSAPSAVSVDGAYPGFAEVHGTYSHFCGRTNAGKVACWGDTFYGYAAWGIPDPDPNFPDDARYVQLESGGDLTGIAQMDAGAVSCAVTTADELYCWGDNVLGTLGVGGNDPHVGAVKLSLANVRQVSVGQGHVCAVQHSGQLYCWGTATLVGLGGAANGDLSSGNVYSTPQAVTGMDDIVEVRAGAGHSCARRRSGEILCWGNNGDGEIGDQTQLDRYDPTPVKFQP